MNDKERLIVSLDFDDSSKALSFVDLIGDDAIYYKVGLQMYLHYGSHFVAVLKKRGKKVFLDLKLNDIPNTVCSAIQVLGNMGVDMINLHTFIGYEGMKQAKETMTMIMPETKLIGVTVLTSLNEEALKEIGFSRTVQEEVLTLCMLGKKAGIDGVVSSAMESAEIKKQCGKDFLTICPGIRRATDDVGDQARVVTPMLAIRGGADYLVIGRPIIKAGSPKEEVVAILKEIEKGLI
jgi:orotidine-5'-phosphate decarboxylase